MKLSPFQLYFRTNLFDKININANGVHEPIPDRSPGAMISDKYVWEAGKFQSGTFQFRKHFNFHHLFKANQKMKKKIKKKKSNWTDQLNDPVLAADKQRLAGLYAAKPG